MAKKAKPAAVMGSLVNLKNVATHKCIALTIHISAEAAQEVLAAFGWPTMVDPVPVAVARLEESAALTQPAPDDVYEAMVRKRARDEQNAYADPPAEKEPYPPTRLRHWGDMTPAQQTGVIRNEPDFHDFAGTNREPSPVDAARNFIRSWCRVESCADILPGTEAAARWAQLQVRYGNWLRTARGAA